MFISLQVYCGTETITDLELINILLRDNQDYRIRSRGDNYEHIHSPKTVQLFLSMAKAKSMLLFL